MSAPAPKAGPDRRSVLGVFTAVAGRTALGGFAPLTAVAVAPAILPMLDMTGTYPHYAAAIGFGRPDPSSDVAEPLDLVFA